MSETLSRQFCPKCNKKNLCTFMGTDNMEKTRCKTSGCDYKGLENNNSNTHELVFKDFDKPYRGISHQTLNYLGIKHSYLDGEMVISYDHNNLSGSFDIKYRWPLDEDGKKRFSWAAPQSKDTSMFALDKCTDFNKPLYITEGNEDAATLHDLGFQACSLLAAGAEKSSPNRPGNIELDIETLNKYPEIILCIEDDTVANGFVGKKVKENIIALLKHKLIRVVDLTPRKDANDWVRDDVEDLTPARDELLYKLTHAQEIVPLGIVFGDQINSVELRKPLPPGAKVPYPQLQAFTKGHLPGHLWLLTAGVSIGKSSVIRDFSVCYRKQGLKVGNIFVEEDARVSQQNYIATELGYPIGEVMIDPTIIPQEQWDQAFDKMLNNPDLMFIDEHWKNTTDNLLKTCEYLATVKKYDILVIDHLTALINASDTGRGGKVQDIDFLMEQLFALGRRTGLRIALVAHLKRPKEPPYWDEGRRPTMYDLRGSGSLEAKPDVIIGMSRNQKSDTTCDILKLEVLKNRWFSKLGMVDELLYVSRTGRLILN